MIQRLGAGFVALGLILAIFWPAVALFGTFAPRGGLLVPGNQTIWTPSTGGVARPISLAWNTIQLVMLASLMALPVGVIGAWLVERTNVRGAHAWRSISRLGLFVPLPLIAIGWLGAFGNLGRSQLLGVQPWLTGIPGAAFVHAVACVPWVMLIMGRAFQAVETDLEDAARLDLPGWQVFVRISLRRTWGAFFGSALVVIIFTASEMTVTDLLQVRTYAEEAYLQAQLGNVPLAASAPQLVCLAVLILAMGLLLHHHEPARDALARIRPAMRWELGAWRWPATGLVSMVGFVLMGVPLYAMVWRAGRVGSGAGRPAVWSWTGLLGTLSRALATVAEPLAESILWAGLGASCATVLGFGLAWLARRSKLWRCLGFAALILILAAPGPLVGTALTIAYNPEYPPAGAHWVTRVDFAWRSWVHDTPASQVLGYAVRTFPFVLVLLWPVAHGFPRAHLESAALDGLAPARRLGSVVIPQEYPALLAAWLASFALALGELAVTYLVSAPGHTPLSVVVWGLMHTGVESHLAGVGLIMLGLIALLGGVAGCALNCLEKPKSL
jgi:iron(III) transport system permease protein